MRNFILLLFITCPLFSGDPQFSTELKEIPIFQNYEGFIHAFGDIDGDGDDDLITSEHEPFSFLTTSQLRLYRNAGNNYTPNFESIENALDILNQHSFSSVRIQDVNGDQLPDITAVYKDSINHVFAFLNSGTLINPVFGEAIDTLFTASTDTFEISDYLLYDLIDDTTPEVVIAYVGNIGSFSEPFSRLNLYKIAGSDSLSEIPGYFNNSIYLDYDTGITRINFVEDPSLNFPYLTFNYFYLSGTDETLAFDAKIYLNTGAAVTPNWQNIERFEDTILHPICDNDSGLFSFSYQINGRGRIESELWYNQIVITENDIEFHSPVLLRNNGNIDGFDTFDWQNDGTEDLVLLINQVHSNGINVPNNVITYHQSVANFVFSDTVNTYFPAPDFNGYWFNSGFNLGEAQSFFDYENDGDADIFLRRYGHSSVFGSYIIINEGDNHQPNWQTFLPNEFNLFPHPQLVDIDNDMDFDLLGINISTQKLQLFLNQGDVNHFELDTIPVDLFSDLDPYSRISAADFDQDGDIDIIADLQYFRNESSSGNFNFAAVFSIPQVPYNRLPILAFDADRDGDNDLIYAEYIYNHPGVAKIYFIENVAPMTVEPGVDIIPRRLKLLGNYPNPFNGETQVEFYLPNARSINLDIFNILGEKVFELYNGQLPAGDHRISWNGRGYNGEEIASGLYFVKLFSENEVASMKILLVK